ncbi:phosphatidylinositol phosphatase PTPRQ [Drosophila ficusphila]|uniref:phosphatidylinositol phosphatase PTPRQ n=1 Tax=Drosophila ficusphila TaxID=30025 RepID=UPI0007E6D09E|nr:phosphatidylinositol phosphatase PTPRQ [Drosophila ficusphila]XP_017049953.1 phosphatidylinositol phosphatase PTPRQ [Drosophila ficusphila]
MDTKHWKPSLKVIALILTFWIAWVQGQSDSSPVAVGESQELADKPEVNVVATTYTLGFSLSDETEYSIDAVTCRNGSGTETKANEDNVCESLTACTFYTCVVSFRSNVLAKPKPSDQTIYAYTEYKQPRTTVTSVVPTSNTIEVRWRTTDRACVESFLISAKSDENSYEIQQLSENSVCIFTGLRACVAYTVTLETKNNASVVVDQDTSEVDTLYAEPGDLAMNVSNLSSGITIVTWGDPNEKNCISNYVFKWRRDDCGNNQDEDTTTTEEPSTETTNDMDYVTGSTIETTTSEQSDNEVECEWTDVSSDGKLREYLLTDLQGCELHTFQVFINENKTAKASQQFTSAEKTSSAVYEPSPTADSTKLLWTWSAPQNHPKCVANYSVMLTGPTQREENKTLETVTEEMFATFEDLDPCGIYVVEIVPTQLNGSSGAKFQQQCTVGEDQPTQILDPEVDPSAYSMVVSWSKPAYADLCIDGYRLSGWMEDEKLVEVEALSVTTQNTTVTFDKNLLACQVYIIQIIPYTRERLDGELRKIEVETRAAIVDSTKVKLEPKQAGSEFLELTAFNADYNNTCPTIFALFSCNATTDVRNPYAERYVEGHSKQGFNASLSPLSPYTTYVCKVILYNVAGPSNAQTLAGVQTSTYFPEEPTEVVAGDKSDSSLVFGWHPPAFSNGPIKYYQAFLMRHEASYFVPEDCAEVVQDTKSETKGDVFVNFTGLAPAVSYMMQVAAQNDFGMGKYTDPVIGTTLPAVSDNVTQLTVKSEGPENNNNEYGANVTITWKVPCKSNGDIEYFQLGFTGQRKNYSSVEFQRRVQLDPGNRQGRMSYTETEMLPQYDYTVQVAVKNRDVEQLSGSVSGSWQSPAGLPVAPSEELIKQMRANVDETTSPTKTAVVRLPADIMTSESGDIKYMALLLSQKVCAGLPALKFDVGADWPPVYSYQTAGADGTGDCSLQYQTTEEHWHPEPVQLTRRSSDVNTSSDQEIVFTIGVDKCSETKKVYCNGPLIPDTDYYVVVRLFTASGYSDAAVLNFRTKAAIKVTLILVSVCSCLLLAFVFGLAVLWVRKRLAWKRDSGQGIEDPFGNVIAKNFAIFYAEVAKPEKLAREFKEITVVALELSYSASELGCHKNRYADIYPYDKNRVILDIDAEGSDYINASFIDGHTRKKEYIATQGPKPESVMDFWRMVLQYNVRIIVQVTQFREGNTIKCHEYYPYTMRGLTVTVKSKEVFDLYDRTELTVVHDKYGLKEKVIHFYFKKWPDHGVPEDPMHLITLVKKVKAEKRPSYSPIVVHCSAGVGRTGTFIGLDLIMQRLKSESKINIFETVKKLRFQRMKMVQTQQQYTFLYACTYELVKHKIPRAALKMEGRPKSVTAPAISAPKKVSFPDVDVGSGDGLVNSNPMSDLENGVPTLQLPARFSGLRRSSPPDEDNGPSTSSNM